jgi:hypothetical protein
VGTYHAGGTPRRRIISCTPSMRICIEAVAGENVGAPGYLDVSHQRRSFGSADPEDFHRVGGGIRLRSDRLEAFVDLLDELAAEAEARGIWRGRP